MRMHHITRIQAQCAWKTANPAGACTFACTAVLSTDILRSAGPCSRESPIDLDLSDDDCESTTNTRADVTIEDPSGDDTDVRAALNGVLAIMADADLVHLKSWKIVSIESRHSCQAAPPAKAGQKSTPFDPSMFVPDCLDQVTPLLSNSILRMFIADFFVSRDQLSA